MKLTVVALLALAAVAYGRSVDFEDMLEETTAYNYHEKIGIPLANKIREAEEAEMRGSRIVGGSVSSLGQFPYQAGLIITSARGQGVCGGSLLNVRRVLTAAHCWWDGRTQGTMITVALGTIRLFFGGDRMNTNDIVMHGSWDHQLTRNDVAMIRLPRNAVLSSTVNVIALPSSSQLNMDFAGVRATASGFGITRDGTLPTINQVLSHVTLNVISNSECQRNPGIGGYVIASNICTSGAGGQSTCSGDSGGPLTTSISGRETLIGITSFGHIDGCQVGHVAVFARVTAFNSWILQNL